MIKLKTLLMEDESFRNPGTKTGKMTSFEKIYETYNSIPEDEILSQELRPDDFEIPIPIYKLNSEDIKQIDSYGGGMKLLSSFKNDSTTQNKKIVKQYINKFNKIKTDDVSEIVVLMGNSIVDGNHRLVAAYMAKKNIFAINMTDLPD